MRHLYKSIILTLTVHLDAIKPLQAMTLVTGGAMLTDLAMLLGNDAILGMACAIGASMSMAKQLPTLRLMAIPSWVFSFFIGLLIALPCGKIIDWATSQYLGFPQELLDPESYARICGLGLSYGWQEFMPRVWEIVLRKVPFLNKGE